MKDDLKKNRKNEIRPKKKRERENGRRPQA